MSIRALFDGFDGLSMVLMGLSMVLMGLALTAAMPALSHKQDKPVVS